MKKAPPRISIVIPALNEEKHLPVLLESIKKQKYKDYEVIVADAGSKDKTVEIAKSYRASVVPGGMPGPGRNRGAEAAVGDFLFFFDSDVILPPDFLSRAMTELDDRFIDLATCEFKPDSNLRLDQVLFHFANLSVKVNQGINPRAAGFCIFTTRRLFNRVGGFDEKVKLAEDHDFVQRASKFRPLKFLNSVHLTVSTRRLDKEGRFSLIGKYAQVEMHLLLKGKVTEDIVEYEFANFDEKNTKTKKFLDDLETSIVDIENKYNDFQKKYQQFRDDQKAEGEDAIRSAYNSVEALVRSVFAKKS